MSAVWRAARAAVRRRRLQTTVIGLVVLFSTATIVVALALLDASSAPFDRAFAQQRGAHAVATFDSAAVSDEQLTQAAQRSDGTVTAGPFRQTVLEVPPGDDGRIVGSLTVVGRADPAGPVDRVDLWQGRWASGPGEIVLNELPPSPGRPSPPLGRRIDVPGHPSLTVVGSAYSVSESADAWVTPDQMTALRPSTTQLLYRFPDAGTDAEVRAGLAAATADLPPDALLAAQSYLVIKAAVAAGPGVYAPFLLVFGVLGLVVAVLIVANVVSGAVVSGFRHIGILKALGFTPRQVVAVYLVMVSVPAIVGCGLGTLAGHLAATPLLEATFQGAGLGRVGVSGWVDLVALLGMPAVVVVTALVPALRAHRLSAAEAISAGSAPRAGRGQRTQRWLSGTRLPRSVSLGLGLPLARPGRTALTLAAVLLGVTTVTFATGLASTVTRYADATDGNDNEHVGVRAIPATGEAGSTLTHPEVEALLRSLPDTVHVTTNLDLSVGLVGYTQPAIVNFLRGDLAALDYQGQLVRGRWLERPGELVIPSELRHERGLAVGDQVALQLDDRRATTTIVGETMSGGPGPAGFLTDWQTLDLLAPGYQAASHEILYQVQLTPGTDIPSYLRAVTAAEPGLDAWDNSGSDQFTVAVVSLSLALTLMLGTVAALGVFHTVVLNTRERRRDLGMLKSIGMTPRQVTVMVVTSMAALGAVGGVLGIPIGVVAHRLIIPVAADAARIDIIDSLLQVWQVPVLSLLAPAGVVIAALGALIPARSAARLPIAQVLHNE